MTNQPRTDERILDAVIIGAGFAGLYAIHHLHNDLGLDVRCYDTATDVGGTWYWNRYPGVRVDTESIVYTYSFDRDLAEEWRWTQRFPRQQEVLGYLQHVASRYGLRRHIKFSTAVTSVAYQQDGTWLVSTTGAEQVRTRFVLMCLGQLSTPISPPLPGLESFEGAVYHTARWPHDGVDLRHQRVGVFGTGSSGIQAITDIAPQVRELVVFQRRPQYCVPARHSRIPAGTTERILDDYDRYWASVRNAPIGLGVPESEIPAMSVSAEERERVFEDAWQAGGGFRFMFGTFSDIATDLEANNAASEFIKRKIKQIVRDSAVAERLTPDEIYARRPICHDGYYETYNRDNVTLIDLRTESLERVVACGIETSERMYELDTLVFATGFDALTGTFDRLDIAGRDGVRLKDHWANGPRCHMGISIAGFPNMFTVAGPFSSFASQPTLHEVQVRWIGAAIRHLDQTGNSAISVSADLETQWMSACAEVTNGTLFSQVDSWMNGSNIDGKARVIPFFMGGFGTYNERLRELLISEFDGFEFDA